MIACYDPVAREVTLHGEDGFARYEARASRLVAKHYQDGGIFVCEMNGETVELAYEPIEGPQRSLRMVPLAPGRWRLVLDP